MGSYLPLSAPPLLSCKFRARTPAVFSRVKETRACRSTSKSGIICAMEGKLEASWFRSDGAFDEDGFGGWSVLRVEEPNRTGLSKVILAGIGTSVVVVLLAALAYCSFSRKGFSLKLSFPFGVCRDISVHYEISKGADNVVDSATPSIQEVPVESAEYKSASDGKKRIVISVPADATQLEALNVLRMLKIIENGANADDLCTRREYARWLVKANFMLERKAKNRLVPTSLLASSVSPAFDDVNLHDPDFWCIQALGEAGIVSSRFSSPNSSNLSDIKKLNAEEGFYFFPNNFISRFDMVNWTAMLEYSNFLELEEISRTKPRLLDLCARHLNAAPQLLVDLISGNRGIVTRTFGNIRRLQPNKPVTKAQAAVALTSGRMAEAIQIELARLEAEELLRSAEMEEIKLELIQRGVVQKYWEEKLCETKIFALQSEKNLEIALSELEIERAEEDRLADYLNEKMALECQQQLLFNLRKEVDEMKEKLRNERGVFTAEKKNLESQLRDLDKEKEAVFEARSVLEAEKDAVQILRSWVEEEAEHIRARANVLEQAVQRWKGGKALSQQ